MTSTTKPVRPELANFEVFVDTCLRLAAKDGRQLPPELADLRRWDRAYRNLVLLTAEHSKWPGPADRDRRRSGDPGTRRSAVTWPLRLGSIPPRADGFQDRTVADVLDYKARQGQAVVLTQVVSGLGGVGKTQLAAAFAKRLWSTGELDLLVWISAVSRDSVVTGYAQAADLILGSHADNKDPNLAATRFLAWLDMTDKRWLVVLDDLRDGTVAQGLWPPDRPVGRTVMTTRRRDASLLTGRSLIDVGVFTSQEATDYIAGKLPMRLADDVEGVAADLGSLPLALGHAAAYMIDQDISCLSYRQRFADQRRRLASLFPDEGAIFRRARSHGGHHVGSVDRGRQRLRAGRSCSAADRACCGTQPQRHSSGVVHVGCAACAHIGYGQTSRLPGSGTGQRDRHPRRPAVPAPLQFGDARRGAASSARTGSASGS
ncbi:MAG: NB-ARC domain-containing protein [Pseudonocardiaceae bacterium]